MHAACRLAPELTSLSAARRYAKSVIGNEPVVGFDIVGLLVTEVVTNAIVHARTPIVLMVRITGETIRVEVHDEDSTVPVVKHADPYGLGGRGMAIVEGLADAWGVTPGAPDGKTVWFEVTRQQVGGALPRGDSLA